MSSIDSLLPTVTRTALVGSLLVVSSASELPAQVASDEWLPPSASVLVAPDSGPPTRGAGGATFEEQVVELVNVERWTNGQLAPMAHETLLDDSSELHAVNMGVRNFFSHCDLDTLTSPGDRMTTAGYFWVSAAENAAAGSSTPAAVMAQWMASSGHRANILSTSRNEIGVGHYLDGADTGNVRLDLDNNCLQDPPPNDFGGPYLHYWVQNFGRRSNVYPVVIDREAYETDVPEVDLYLYGASWPATEMRIRNESGTFTSWMPFETDVTWTLHPVAGERTVEVEIRNAAMTVLSHLDTIVLTTTSDEIFSDGFESGDTTSWTSTTP